MSQALQFRTAWLIFKISRKVVQRINTAAGNGKLVSVLDDDGPHQKGFAAKILPIE